MNDSEYEQGQASASNNNHVTSNKSIGSPSSPSSLSSASSTTSNHSSSSSSSQQHQQNALQAAVQALMHQQSGHTGLLTQEKPSNMQAIQQQQQINQLLASIAAAQQHQNSQQSTNVLLNNLMQQQLEGGAKKAAGVQKLNVKTKGTNNRSLKGHSVSPPGTGASSCSDEHEAHSPSDSDLVKSEPNYDITQPMDSNTDDSKNQRRKAVKSEYSKLDEGTDHYEHDLDRSTNSSIAENSHNQDQELEDELDDYETSFSRDSKRHRNHSTSSPTRSTSSRSTSPSTTSYHDSPAAFPSLNPLDSATAMLGGLNCTPNGLNSFLDISTESGKKRRTLNGDLSMSERNKKIKPVPADKKDDAYWERRRKNNEAAKRSRDLRRQKEDEIAVKATVLEQENLKLKAQVTILKAELSKLHFMLYNR